MSMTPSQNRSLEHRPSLYASPIDRKTALRQALKKANSLQQQADPEALNDLTEMVEKVDAIHFDWENSERNEKIENSDQVLMDSQLMSISSNVIRSCMDSISKEMSSYKRSEFARKLLQHAQRLSDDTPDEPEENTHDEPNWSLFEDVILPRFLKTPEVSFLLSSMNPIAKPERVQTVERSVAQRRLKREKEAKIAIKKVESVTTLEKEENTVEQTVHRLSQKIRQLYKQNNQKPINYFKLVLNPHDFGKTIENILHTSFLVRDGRLRMIVVEGHLHVIPTSVREKETAERNGTNINIQNVESIDYEQWEQLIKYYNITEPVIDF